MSPPRPARGRSPSIAVVLPTYNERANLARLAERLLAVQEGLCLVVVDDASPDGTGEVADGLARQHPGRVFVMHRPAKLGLGTAHLEGFRIALELDRSWIVTMDADLSHDPADLPSVLAPLAEGAQLVIGSRYVAGGATPDFPLRRRLLSGTANLVAHSIAGLSARDATSGFRCYDRGLLTRLPLSSIRSDGYSFLIEMLFLAQAAGCRIAEVPIVFRDREHGVSKISRTEVRKAVATVLRLGLRRLRRWRPRGARGGLR